MQALVLLKNRGPAMKNRALYGKAIWFITGVASLCVGLGAMGVDMETMLHLASISNLLRYGVGLAGALSLILLATSCASQCGSGTC